MGTALVTVSGRGTEVDLALPDDVAIAALIPALVARCETEPRPWSRWALGTPDGGPFPPSRSLAELGVVDGCELRLRDMVGAGPDESAVARSSPDPSAPGWSAETETVEPRARGRRERLVDLVERTVDDIWKIRMGRNPLLEYAAPEVRRRMRGMAPPPLEQPAARELSDLELVVRWHAHCDAAVPAVARFIERSVGAANGYVAAPPPPAGEILAQRVILRLIADCHCRQLLDLEVASQPSA